MWWDETKRIVHGFVALICRWLTANSDLYLLLIKEVEVKIALIENPLQKPQQLKKNIEEIATT